MSGVVWAISEHFFLIHRVLYTNNVLLCEQITYYDDNYYYDDKFGIKGDEDSLRGSRCVLHVSSLFKFISFILFFYVFCYI